MDDDVERVSRYVEDLMADRRPATEPVSNEQALRAMQAAAVLAGTKWRPAIPSQEFLTRLEIQIVGRIRKGPTQKPTAGLAGRPD